MKNRALRFVFSLLTLYSVTATAVYKWVDENGQTIYSQSPPPASGQQKVETLPDRSGPGGDKECCLKILSATHDMANLLYRGGSRNALYQLTVGFEQGKELSNFVFDRYRENQDYSYISEKTMNFCMRGAFTFCRAIPKKDSLKDTSVGTGFFVNPLGYLITNHHVAGECRQLSLPQHPEVNVTLVASDPRIDLAILKTSIQDNRFVQFESDKLALGQTIFTFGYGLTGLLSNGLKVTSGNVSALEGLKDDRKVFQISAPIVPGNSGGPILNRSGHLIGVAVSSLSSDASIKNNAFNVFFAVQKTLAESILRAHKIPYEVAADRDIKEPEILTQEAERYTVLIRCDH